MTRQLMPLLAAAVYLCVIPVASSQVNVRSITLRAGAIQNPWNQFGADTPFRPYPEVQIRGQLIVPCINWGLSWGYWSDGISRALPVMDAITYSYRAHILSLQLAFEPRMLDSHFPIPMDLIVGVAEHLTSITYIGGTDWYGHPGVNSSSQSMTGIFGIRISVPVISSFGVEADALQFVPLKQADKRESGRRTFLAGVYVLF